MEGRRWSESDLEYLQENWGQVSLQGICKKLGRSENAVKIKVQKQGLGSFLESGEYITFNQLLIAIGYGGGYSYKPTSWIENRDFPIKYRTVNRCRFKVVYIDDFWEWAEKNRDFLDFSKFEQYSLGQEPDWVGLKRQADFERNRQIKTSPWTKAEDRKLIDLLSQYKYGYKDLSKLLFRSEGAIQRRINDLKLLQRPIKAENHNKWSDNEYLLLGDLIKQGLKYTAIAEHFEGRSEKSLRGLVFRYYKTENLDKVRDYIGNDEFGDNAPEFTVWEKRRTAVVKNNISSLVSLLKMRRNALGWDEYWQKDMCMNWDNIDGCRANERNCDECNSFVRIKPQYCVRCGITFFERQENKICNRCRVQRKKQAYWKYSRMGENNKLNEEVQDEQVNFNG